MIARIAIGLFCAATLAVGVGDADQPGAPDFQSLGKTLTQQLASRQFEQITAHFDETMASAMPAAKLSSFWDTLIGQVGAFQSIEGARLQDVQGYKVVLVTSKFEKATLDAKWVFDSKGRIAGFFVVPSHPEAPWSAPDYAVLNRFRERPAVVGTSPWQLDGTLAVPEGAGPFAAVVLVHGSGPQDQDEAIGPNKPFKDVAWGLASRNIVVLRYNKRTLQHAKELKASAAGFTVNEETVEDARAAVDLLLKQPEVDPKRVFVLGHSLGGMLAPRIAQGDAHVAGLIVMAGTPRPIEKVIVQQFRYLVSLHGKLSPAEEEQIAAAEQTVKEIESPTLTAGATVNLLGTAVPGSYFLDLRDYHAAEVAAQLKHPMLILQAERDYQVTMEDFDGWKKTLIGDQRTTFKLYPGLFHLFMPSTTPGTGLGSPTDYEKAGHVSEAVILDIGGWVSEH
jgi:dienelactone hydrolase